MNKQGIYKIISPSNKVQIGQSTNIEKRWRTYELLNCKQQVKLYNSLNKYGVEHHKFEIIENCEIEELNSRERYWQDFYNVLGENGLNLTLVDSEELPKVWVRLRFRDGKSYGFWKLRTLDISV